MPRRSKNKPKPTIELDPKNRSFLDTSISLINKLKLIKKTKSIEESNEIISKFQNLDFLPKNSKVYFRHFIPYALEKIEKLYLKEALILINDIYANLYPFTS